LSLELSNFVMKILMIAPQPFFEPRGTPISVYQRLQGLSMLGHQVDLITYPIGKDIAMTGVRIHRTISLPMVRTVRIGPSWTKLLLDMLLFFKVFWMLLSRRYDVIHTHEEGAFLALLLSPLFRIPHLYDMHSSLPRQLKNFKSGNSWIIVNLFKKLEELVLRSCSVVITIGADLEEYVLKQFPQANHIRIENIPLGNDKPGAEDHVAEIKTQLDLHNKFPIVYTGTFESYQGLGLLFTSANQIIEKHPEVILVMVGGKPDQIKYWEEETKKLGLENNVVFVGMVPLEVSLIYLEMAEILVSPRTDGLSVPLKLYSYLQSGKPIVATNIYAHTQILDEEIAVIVDPEPASLAAGIINLIEHPKFSKEIARKARIFAEEQFSIDSFLSKLDKAYMAIKYSIPIAELSHAQEVGEARLQLPEAH
jgi:glycosyltransferase involved in cell wall biosynthesis